MKNLLVEAEESAAHPTKLGFVENNAIFDRPSLRLRDGVSLSRK